MYFLFYKSEKDFRNIYMSGFYFKCKYKKIKKRFITLFFIFFCFFPLQVFPANTTFIQNSYSSEQNHIPRDVLEFAYKKGYGTPKRLWYMSNTCIKNIIYTDIFYTEKKNNNGKYRYILYNDKHLRFATKTEQWKYIESRYF